jgi:hypothetical protein
MSRLPPKYVRLHGSELRLRGDEYYKDGGHWYVGYKYVNDVLRSVDVYGMPHLNNVPLIEITKQEWLDGNRGYTSEVIDKLAKEDERLGDLREQLEDNELIMMCKSNFDNETVETGLDEIMDIIAEHTK